MILTCPSCGTQYVLKDGAIPPGGRQVRCAACKHSWHQDPEESTQSESQPQPIEQAPAPPSEPQAEEDESLTGATLIEPRSGPEAEERAFEEAGIEEADRTLGEAGDDVETAPGADPQLSREQTSDFAEPPQAEAQDDEFTPFPAPDEVEPRRRNPLVPILIVIVVVVIVAAAVWFFAPPEFKARLGLAGVSASPLALVTTHMDRQRLESGQELLTVTGRVINPTGAEQSVPPLQAQLKNRTGALVKSWTIPPPARSLAPGASASFNSAEVNVPPGGDELTITLGAKGV